jgi:hypothetical protein
MATVYLARKHDAGDAPLVAVKRPVQPTTRADRGDA